MAGSTLSMIPATLIGAVIFSLIPAAVYTLLMELWLRFLERRRDSLRRPIWAHLSTITFSTVLGTAAGIVLHLATEAPVIGIGAITGFLIGAYLVKTQRS